MPTVSVIIPNYNREHLVGITIENILSQTLQPKEIIVVDDGSTDNSVEVIRSFGSKVTPIAQTNQGPGAARNAGLKVATGDYIQFFDSDDLCSLNKLECQVKALEATGSDIAYSPWAKVYIESQQVRFENHVLQQKQLPDSLSPFMWFLRTWNIVFQTCMFRHSFIKQVGDYRTDLMPSEDSEFLFRMLLHKPKLQFVSDCLVLYRLHAMGQITDSGTTKNSRIIDWAKLLQQVEFQLIESRNQVDVLTWLLFQTRVWQSKRDLKGLQGLPKFGVENSLSDFEVVYRALNFYRRIEAGLRGRITGSRYLRSYQASYPTEYQYQLIRSMGYELALS